MFEPMALQWLHSVAEALLCPERCHLQIRDPITALATRKNRSHFVIVSRMGPQSKPQNTAVLFVGTPNKIRFMFANFHGVLSKAPCQLQGV